MLARSSSQVYAQALFLFFRNTFDFPLARNIISAVPLRPGGAPVSSPAQERDATDPSRMRAFRAAARRKTRSREVVKGRRPADEVGGPRTQQCGDAKHSVKVPGAWCRWELQADKTVACGTQALACFRGGCPGSLAVCSPKAHGAMCLRRHMAPCVHPRGAAGAVKRPVVPHAPSGMRTRKRPASPGAGRDTGR